MNSRCKGSSFKDARLFLIKRVRVKKKVDLPALVWLAGQSEGDENCDRNQA